MRSRIEDWLKAVGFTRAEPQFTDAGDGALQHNLYAQVIAFTRWDHEDLIGWLLAQETGDAPQERHILNLPAISEHPAERQSFPATCTLEPDWRTPEDALCPERFPLSELLKIRSRVVSYWWKALCQLQPSTAKGDHSAGLDQQAAVPQRAAAPLGPAGALLRSVLQGGGAVRPLRLRADESAAAGCTAAQRPAAVVGPLAGDALLARSGHQAGSAADAADAMSRESALPAAAAGNLKEMYWQIWQ